MIIKLRLSLTRESGTLMPADYHYLFSAVIYKKIALEDPDFARRFHDNGYGNKRTKFFTFSDLCVPYKYNGDRIELLQRIANLTICFHHDEVAHKFVAGLMKEPEFSIHDVKSSVKFTVVDVKAHEIDLGYGLMTVVAEPISPCVSGYKITGMRDYQFFSPQDVQFCHFIVARMIVKYREVYSDQRNSDGWFKRNVTLRTLSLDDQIPQERTVVVSPGKNTECRFHGYTHFQFEITAPVKFIKLMFETGVGIGNSQGCGCLQLISKTPFHAGRNYANR